MTDKEIIIDGVDVSGCDYYEYCGCIDDNHELNQCENNRNCYYKQLKRLEAENAKLKEEIKKLKYYLNKIRDDELSSMDIEWDEYITQCTSTEYINIINFVELALGERKE